MVTHREKVKLSTTDLTDRGVGRFLAAPPAYRLAWFFGLRIPPPHFQSVSGIALFTGGGFGVLFGVAFYGIVTWEFTLVHALERAFPGGEPVGNIELWFSLAAAPLSGALFGLCMAAYVRRQARRLHLPAWKDYPTTEPKGVGN